MELKADINFRQIRGVRAMGLKRTKSIMMSYDDIIGRK